MATVKERILERIRSISPGTVSGQPDLSTSDEVSPDPTPKQEILNRIKGLRGLSQVPEADPTFVQALATGVRNGFVAPLTIFGVEDRELPLEETHDKVAGAVGEFLGYGLGFIPFGLVPGGAALRIGGYAMKGVGFTSSLSPAVREFVRFTLGGSIQAAGTAEELSEVPEKAAEGAVLGALIDGFFLARALKNRPKTGTDLVVRPRSDVEVGTGTPPPGEPIIEARAWRVDKDDKVYPIAALPRTTSPSGGGQLVRTDVLRQEIRLLPSPVKQLPEISTTVRGLREDEPYEVILSELVEEDFVQSLLLEGIEPRNTKSLIQQIKKRAPNAQILSRSVIPRQIDEIFVHNPSDPASNLRPDQIARWLEGQPIPGQEAVYRGTTYKATGLATEEGFVQLKSLDNRSRFAARREEVHFPITPTLFENFSPKTPVYNEMTMVLKQDLPEVGFTIRSRQADAVSVRRGVVNTEDFLEYKTFSDFMADHGDAIARIEAESVEEAVQLYAARVGIAGIKEVEEGVLKKVTVFDQDRVKFINEPPRIGVDLDISTTSVTQEGKQLLHSFEPSWKNSIVGPLRNSGFSEKDIQSFIEQRAVSEARRIERIMDKEFVAAANASRAQFLEGCF